jgi:hypothetical protein
MAPYIRLINQHPQAVTQKARATKTRRQNLPPLCSHMADSPTFFSLNYFLGALPNVVRL